MTEWSRSGTMGVMDAATGAPTLSLRHRPSLAGVVAPASLALIVVGLAGAFAVDAPGFLDRFVDRFILFGATNAVAFSVLGWLLARHQPGSRLATIAAGIGAGFALVTVLDRYSELGFDRGWPGVPWTLWVGQWAFAPSLWAIPTLLVLRLPDGELPSPRWRAAERAALAGMVVGTVGWALTPYGVLDTAPTVPLDNPVAVDGALPLNVIGAVLVALAAIAALAGLARRTAQAQGVLRVQLRWAFLGVGAAVLLVATGALLQAPLVSCLGMAMLPAALAVAVVRHGLWDVDVILHRSLVYGALTAAVLLVYASSVAVLGGMLGRTSGAPLVATAVVAVGVQPLRERLQRGVSRLLYGHREEPYTALARVGSQLDAAVDRGALLAGVTDAVVRAMKLRGAAITIGGRTVTCVGDLGRHPVEVPLTASGEDIGALRVGVADGDQLRPADLRLLSELARQVSAAVRAETLQAEVEASRARLVSAREEERRRIRRDLHDELGPTLAALAMEVERVGLEAEAEPAAAAARLDDIADRIRDTVRSVRSLVEGLRPPALDEMGLAEAVRELAGALGRGPVVVEARTDNDLGTLPAAVEAAAYRIVAEALTNVVRHAGARRCAVTLRRAGATLDVVIEDDGCGVGAAPAGVGRRSMAERAAELGGTLELAGAPGGGTRVRAALPLALP